MKSRALYVPAETRGGLPGLAAAKCISCRRLRRFSSPRKTRQSMHRRLLAHVRTALLLLLGERSATSIPLPPRTLRLPAPIPTPPLSLPPDPPYDLFLT